MTIELLRMNSNVQDVQSEYERILTEWGVQCAVSGEWISLADLRYWDVDTQVVWSNPKYIPRATKSFHQHLQLDTEC